MENTVEIINLTKLRKEQCWLKYIDLDLQFYAMCVYHL